MTVAWALAVNHYLCPQGMAVGTFLDLLKARGFERVGLTERAFLEAGGAAALQDALSARGMSVSSINSAGFFLAEGEDAVRQAERNRALIDWARAFKDAVLNVIVGGSPTLTLRDARARIPDALARLAGAAGEAGVRIVVEPLHVLNVRGKSCLNTIHQVEDLFEALERIGIGGLSLNLDLFHLWWDADLDALLEGRSVPVGLFQVCDAAQDPATGLPRRVPLGEGHADWQGALAAVRRAFPDTQVELELFADQMPGRDIEPILTAARPALMAQEEA